MKMNFNKKLKNLVCGLLAIATLCSCAGCETLRGNDSSGPTEVSVKYLVDDGKCDYSVVIAENASEAEVFAAKELVSFTEQVTGVKLSLKRDNEVAYGETAKVISIGKNKLSKKAGVTLTAQEVNTDGFAFRNVGDMIFINGYCDRGTLYGVYEFIERYLGVKFLTSDTTYIPENEDVMIEENLNILEKPAFEIRNLYSSTTGDQLFASRRRLTPGGGEGAERYGGGFRDTWYDWNFHNTMTIVKTSPVFEENKDAWLNNNYNMICYTNGLTDDGEVDQTMEVSAVKAVINEVKRKILDSSDTQKFFMIGQEDHYAPCDCNRCQASIAKNGNRAGMMMVWMNAIAKEIEAWAKETVPNKEYYISCFAYQWSATAPVKADPATGGYVPFNENVVPHKSVYVFYAPIGICYYHTIEDTSCTMNDTGRVQLNGWKALTDRLCIWDYGVNYRHFLWWFPNLGVLKDNLQIYQQYGVRMIRHQAACFDDTGYQQQLNTYVISKLMWNINQDVYQLVEEFNKYYFEEGAEEMNAFVDLFESHYAMLNIHTDLYESSQDFLVSDNFPLELLQKAISYTEEGFAKVNASNRTDAEKRNFAMRFNRATLQPSYMIVKNIKNYALGDDEKNEFVKNFFRMVDSFEMANFGEGRSVINFKAQYGY